MEQMVPKPEPVANQTVPCPTAPLPIQFLAVAHWKATAAESRAWILHSHGRPAWSSRLLASSCPHLAVAARLGNEPEAGPSLCVCVCVCAALPSTKSMSFSKLPVELYIGENILESTLMVNIKICPNYK